MLDVINLNPTIGSEVRADAETLLSGAVADELRQLLVQRGVLVMRGIDFDTDQQRTFTSTIGAVRQGLYEEDGLLKVVDIRGTYFWHLDGAYTEIPPFATVLTPQVIPPNGGQTEFANSYAAYEALSDEEKERLEPLEVMHAMRTEMDGVGMDPSVEQIQESLKHRRSQPLVWKHASGRKSLVIGTTASYVIGMHPADSKELLDGLLAHATQEQFVYRHEWQPGDVVIWDNTGTLHRVRPFDLASGRLMHRFAVEGVEPFVGSAS